MAIHYNSKKMTEMTYAKAGVNIEREEFSVKKMKGFIEKTFQFREGKIGEVMQGVGSFANLIDLGPFALAMCIDGVGSKVLVAQELDKYDTIGIDLVAMNVNDLICVGAEPLAMVDYLATQHIDPVVNRDISKGIYEGAKKAGIAVIGGETATLPDVIQGIKNKGFDLAGTAVGVVKKNEIITGEKIRENDVVLGFKSSGVHSNGLTLARKLLPKNMWIDLLTPTRIYVAEVLELMKEHSILGMAHITGGGMRNLLRVTDKGFYIDNMPKIPPIFRKIQELGEVSDLEMYKTFNMGIGLCIVVDEESGKDIIESYGRDYGITRAGKVVDDPGVTIIEDGKEITIN